MTIVGVAAGTVYTSLRETVPPTLFTSVNQLYVSPAVLSSMTVGVRVAAGSPYSISRSVAAAVRQINPDYALTFRPLSVQFNASLAQERVTAILAGFVGLLAVMLAGLGLYGTTWYGVTQRRSEFGIRMAFGASGRDIVRLVMGRVSYLVAAGVAFGVAASLLSAPLVTPLLYGVEPRDGLTLAAAAITLATVTAVAAMLPARHAASADPAEVLRHH
jgi:putative ABC transport system permease protein